MNINIVAVLVAALIPMVMGFVWYNPKVFGGVWQRECGLSDEKMKSANMALIFGLSLVFSFILAFGLQFMVIHQFHVTSLFFMQPINDASTEAGALYQGVMNLLGTSYRTFKHGALHGFIGGIMTSLPIIAINALFERRSFKYVAINVGYWVITMCLMGGIISAWM